MRLSPKLLSWRFITFLYIPLLIAGGLVVFSLTRQQQPPFETASASIKDLTYKVNVTGTVKKAEEFELQFKNSGKISGIDSEVGDSVKEGAIIAQQENTDLTSQIGEARATVAIAQAQLNQAKAGSTPEEIQIAQTNYNNAVANLEVVRSNNAASISSTQTAYDNAVKNLADVRKKADQDLRQAVESALNTVQSSDSKVNKALLKTLKNMRETYFARLDQNGVLISNSEQEALQAYSGNSTYGLLGAVDYLNQARINASESNVILATEKMIVAAQKTRDALQLVRNAMSDSSYGATSTDKTTVEGEITTMNTEIYNLTTAKQSISTQKTTNDNNINSAQRSVDTASQSLSVAQTQAASSSQQAESQVGTTLDQLNLKKSGPRTVDIQVAQARVFQSAAALATLENKLKDTQIIAPVDGTITAMNIKKGETTQPGGIAVKMISLSDNQIEANVSEIDIAHIKVNDPATITLDAFPYGRGWSGRVVKVDPAQTVIQDVIYYKITVAFSSQDKEIKPGMTANLEITTDTKNQVLTIPQRAVIERGQESFVRIPRDKTYVERQISLGLRSSSGDAEVLSGLVEGDKVITFIQK